jgi:hypothetical protein
MTTRGLGTADKVKLTAAQFHKVRDGDIVFSSRTIARKCLILVPTISRELRRFCVAIATSGPCIVSLEI